MMILCWEGMLLVMGEVMMMGLLIVLMWNIGLVEYLQGGQYGVLILVCDVNVLIIGLMLLLIDFDCCVEYVVCVW